MTARTAQRAAVIAAITALATTGCVDRRFVIESNVPNAQVYIDNRAIGPAPAHSSFEYYGYYTVKIVHPGYETLEKRIHVAAPWYAYPPIDFLAEIVWPFHIRDTRRHYFELYEATQTRTDDILNAAEALRLRGTMLPPPERPAEPRPPKPQPQPPLPPPAPVVPSVLP
ncbi:MAG TPA: PEGA domain-containing protein [Gemmata sp.]